MNKRLILCLLLVLAVISTFSVPIMISAAGPYPYTIGPVGGSSTQTFDDYPTIPPQMPITRVVIGAGEVIDSIQVYYGNTAMPKHGGNGGSLHIVDINPNDYITEISGFYGYYVGIMQIGQITIKTRSGNTYGPYGTANVYIKQAFSLKTANDTEQIVALFGGSYLRSNGANYISALGVYVTPTPVKVGPYGGSSANAIAFDDYVTYHPQSPITRLDIRHGEIVDAIKVYYGSVTYQHGGNGGNLDTVLLGPGEYITGISGVYGFYLTPTDYVIGQIMITTNIRQYGPYGNGAVGDLHNFTLNLNSRPIVAFCGSTVQSSVYGYGVFLSTLGAYVW